MLWIQSEEKGLCCHWVQRSGSATHLQGDDAGFPKANSTSTACTGPDTAPSTLEDVWALPPLLPADLGSGRGVLALQLQHTPLSVHLHGPMLPKHPQAHFSARHPAVGPSHPQLVPPLLPGPSPSMKSDLGDSDITLACISVQAHQQQTGQ